MLRESTAGAEPAECVQPLGPKRRENSDREGLRLEQKLSQRYERKGVDLGQLADDTS